VLFTFRGYVYLGPGQKFGIISLELVYITIDAPIILARLFLLLQLLVETSQLLSLLVGAVGARVDLRESALVGYLEL